MSYDNPRYWQDLHRQLAGQLRAVGYPNLSEAFNQLKYESEAQSVVRALDQCRWERRPVRVLELGAGTGYWCRLLREYLQRRGLESNVTALDISADALASIRASQPGVATVQADLTKLAPETATPEFDLVYSFYCLHHLPRLAGFVNALRYASRTVAPGGYLVIMDPVLSQPYSLLDTFDFYDYSGNGVPRHRCLIEDVLEQEGLRRSLVLPAVSFLLNGAIEARGRLGFVFRRRLWELLRRVYRSDRSTRRAAKLVASLDARLKRGRGSASSSVNVYQKSQQA